MKHLRSIVTFAAIAIPGALVATTSFLFPLTPGTLDRSPEQVRMPTADTRSICPGPLLVDGSADGTDAEFVDDSNVSTRVVAASAPISATDGSETAARLSVGDLGGPADFETPAGGGFVSGNDEAAGTRIITGFARPGAPALTTGMETVEGTSGDLTGLATLSCSAPASNFRILAGSGKAGSNSQLLLSNPGDAPVQAEVTVMTPSGSRGEPTAVSIKPGAQRAVRLAGLAGGAEALAVNVKVDGGVVAGSIQETLLDGLTPKGIDLATNGATAGTSQVLTGLGGKNVRIRVANPNDELARVQLKAFGPEGEIRIPRSSMTVVADGVAEADLGELDSASVVIESDRAIQSSGFISQDGVEGASDFASIIASEPLSDTQILGLPRTGSGTLSFSPGLGQIEVRGMLDDGSLSEPRTVDLNPSATVTMAPAELSSQDVRAVVLGAENVSGSQGDGVHANLVQRTESGISALNPAPAPAGVAYRDIRLK